MTNQTDREACDTLIRLGFYLMTNQIDFATYVATIANTLKIEEDKPARFYQ